MLRVNEVPWRETWYTYESLSSATHKARDSARHYWYDRLKSLYCASLICCRTANSGDITDGSQAYPAAHIRQTAPPSHFLTVTVLADTVFFVKKYLSSLLHSWKGSYDMPHNHSVYYRGTFNSSPVGAIHHRDWQHLRGARRDMTLGVLNKYSRCA